MSRKLFRPTKWKKRVLDLRNNFEFFLKSPLLQIQPWKICFKCLLQLTLILLRTAHDIALERLLLLLLVALIVTWVIVRAGARPWFSRLLNWLLRLLADYIILSRHNAGVGSVGWQGVLRLLLLLPWKTDFRQFNRLLVQGNEVLNEITALVQDLVKLVVLRNCSGLLLLK